MVEILISIQQKLRRSDIIKSQNDFYYYISVLCTLNIFYFILYKYHGALPLKNRYIPKVQRTETFVENRQHITLRCSAPKYIFYNEIESIFLNRISSDELPT